jgi:Icc-related predicted phosphoesterase
MPRLKRQILHLADIHGNPLWLNWLSQQYSKFELVVIAGDLLALMDPDEHRQIRDLTAVLREFRGELAICSGNHDFPLDALPADPPEWISALRSSRCRVDGDRFRFAGRLIRCLGWNEPPKFADPGDFWVCHAPPSDSPTGTAREGGDFGDFEIGSMCHASMGPRLLFHGHVHGPKAFIAKIGQTICLNPGHSPTASVPNHFVVDLDKHTAEHRSLGRSGRLKVSIFDLDNPAVRKNGSLKPKPQ